MSGSTGARAGAGTRTRARTRAPEVKRLYEPMGTGWLHGGGRAKGEGDGHMIPKAFWHRGGLFAVPCCVLCAVCCAVLLGASGLTTAGSGVAGPSVVGMGLGLACR